MYSNFYKIVDIENAQTWKTGIFNYSTINDIQKIDDLYYAVGTNGKFVSSGNGKIWNDINLSQSGNLVALINLTGNFEYYDIEKNINRTSNNLTIIANSVSVFRTYNFEYTEEFNLGYTKNITCGAVAFNKLFLSGENGLLSYSEDGETWNVQTTDYTGTINKLCFLNNVLYAIGSGVILYTTDGENWQTHDLSAYTTKSIKDMIAYKGAYYITDGNSIFYTIDFQNWETVTSSFDSSVIIQCFATDEEETNLYVFGINGQIGLFDEENDKINQITNLNVTIKKVIYDSSLYLGVGSTNFYMNTEQKRNLNSENVLLETSKVALETIIKEIVIINENTTIATCSLWIENNSVKTNLIALNSRIEAGSSLLVLRKPMILTKGDKLIFKSDTYQTSASVLYSYGD